MGKKIKNLVEAVMMTKSGYTRCSRLKYISPIIHLHELFAFSCITSILILHLTFFSEASLTCLHEELDETTPDSSGS